MQSIPKTVKEKCRGVNGKQLALKCAPYVIFGYVFNKVSWLYGQQAGDNTLQKVLDTINGMGGAFANPFPSFMPRDLLVGVGCGIGFRMVVYYKAKNAKKFRQGVEYGSARWGTAKDIEPYVNPVFENNVLLTATERLMMSGRPKQPKYARNKNILVIGGSGSGKTRFFVKPNLMQMHSSYVVTDPKETVLEEVGTMLARGAWELDDKGNKVPKVGKNGQALKTKSGKVIYKRTPYKIKVFNTINFAKSMHYNPFAYIHTEQDVLKFVNTLIANTKGEGAQSGEDFWVKAERLLFTAYVAYIVKYCKNVHFKKPFAPTYMEQLKQMEADGMVSLRGLRKDATLFNEIVIDVNTMYFERNGGYEYAKQFYEEAFRFIEEKFGADNVISAVMHADEINVAATEELGKEVYHYHLHAMVLPVVEKEILWSKRCKDEKLRGTVKKVVHQISHSKKWKSDIPLTDEKGNPLFRKNGKTMFRASYSILQDELFNYMTERGFKGFQRGEYGSTAEHLTSLQYQIKRDKGYDSSGIGTVYGTWLYRCPGTEWSGTVYWKRGGGRFPPPPSCLPDNRLESTGGIPTWQHCSQRFLPCVTNRCRFRAGCNFNAESEFCPHR